MTSICVTQVLVFHLHFPLCSSMTETSCSVWSSFHSHYQYRRFTCSTRTKRPPPSGSDLARSGTAQQLIPRYFCAGLIVFTLFSPLPGGLIRFGLARFQSTILQLQAGHPLIAASTLLTETADVLQGLALQRLHLRVLQNTVGTDG